MRRALGAPLARTVAILFLGGGLALAAGCGGMEEDLKLPGYPDPSAASDARAWPSTGADAGVAYSDGAAAADGGAAPTEPIPAEDYGKWVENDFVETTAEPLSTFSIDVDTASYTVMRQALGQGQLPDPNGVRVEEYINYFSYDYPQPTEGPFSINTEAAPSRFGAGYEMLRVGLQGLTLPEAERKPANLVFLIDVSGSMGAPDKLPLVKSALSYLVGKLETTDTLGIVTYSTNVQELLQPTPVTDKTSITQAISALSAGGSTAGGPGIQTAYDMAKRGFITGGINRVILCTDGDFNVGLNGTALISYVEQRRDEGITLSALGFGTGNYNDGLLEQLSNKGNGNYAYIDSMAEAEKVFGEKLLGTLQVIAKDVKIQVEFNSAAVFKYRLVGYENRLLQPQDFTDDTKDAGEIGAGHQVTALYELEALPNLAQGDVLATVRFRYKEPDGTVSKELTRVIRAIELGPTFAQASPDYQLAVAVAELAEILRHSKHSQGARFADVRAIAAATAGTDADRLELVTLIDKAAALWP